MLKTLCDGTLVYCQNNDIFNIINQAYDNQQKLNTSSKFKAGTIVKVTASMNQLIKYYMSTGETDLQAKNHAILILAAKTGEILGATKCTEGMFYTLEMETEPMAFLPESFLSY